ncbi:MAG: hypothetical protein H7Y03_07305 [Chitinophagaceae bacterium]|nr:hypothetical protein [Chitinophagaceae bacterium]
MGTFKSGILGGFSGKVGTVVGSRWRGIDYMRSRSTSTRKAGTPLQIEQRAKFARALRFVQSMLDLIKIGFREQAKGMTEMNSALAYTLKNAITGTLPDFTIAYNAVLVTRGSLPNGLTPLATPGAAGNINFSWVDNSRIGKALPSDQAILVAFCEELGQSVYVIAAARSAQAGVLNVPGFSGKTVQTWISFISETRKDVAQSIFTGEVVVV